MEALKSINGLIFANMIKAGAMNLRNFEQEVNDLNVFPIPDGDTGSNMLLTIMGGVHALDSDSSDISIISRRVADGMLLSARGNSGVILSQFFNGIAKGFESLETADSSQLYEALKQGVHCAYESVIEPTEGTILTVARHPLQVIESMKGSLEKFFLQYIVEAKNTLARTPDMLPILKKAGVVDSGGAGLIYILEGMGKIICGELKDINFDLGESVEKTNSINLDLFSENDVLEFGYCTEVLLRLQKSKTDIDSFDIKTVTDFLQTLGNSVVAFKTGSIVKIHVHTFTPYKVLERLQDYGEYLTVKIENMSIQHNEVTDKKSKEQTIKKDYAVVAVCSGEGVKQMFLDRDADVIVDGGQSMNPSTEDFIDAFKKVNARNIFVLPNNGNVTLAAKQAAGIYNDANVLVVNSKTIGDGFSALSMMNPNEKDANVLLEEMNEAMEGVVTAKISRASRDSETFGKIIKVGDYIGFEDKDIIASSTSRVETVMDTLEALNFSNYDSCIVIKGKDATDQDVLEEKINQKYTNKEFYYVDGKQEIYDYMLIIQ